MFECELCYDEGMEPHVSKQSQANGCLSQIGLLSVLGCGTVLVVILTLLFPPWVKVKCQRQELLYFSTRAKVYDRTFAGFDFIFSGQKWTRTPDPNVSGQLFDSTEYDIYWPVLIGEWLVVVVGAGIWFIKSSR